MGLHVVIPAGGHGTRLWPLSRAETPKFLVDVGTGEPLIHDALRRALAVAQPKNIRVITGRRHAPATTEALHAFGIGPPVVEPSSRDTTAALALATFVVAAKDEKSMILSLPADHLVRSSGNEWTQTVAHAMDEAAAGQLVCVGVRPTSAHTGYGYAQVALDQPTPSGYRVRRFREKPDQAMAESFADSKDHYWNTAIAVWSAATFADRLRQYAPDIAHAAAEAADSWLNTGAVPVDLWETIRAVAIEYALLEPAARDGFLSLIPAPFRWRDVGTWASVADTVGAPPADHVLTRDAMNCLVLDSAKGAQRRYALLGVRDLIVVDTGDVVLVLHRAAAEQVKDLAAAAYERGWLDLA
jgi:mannose-1-phosphate guanylyltransferase